MKIQFIVVKQRQQARVYKMILHLQFAEICRQLNICCGTIKMNQANPCPFCKLSEHDAKGGGACRLTVSQPKIHLNTLDFQKFIPCKNLARLSCKRMNSSYYFPLSLGRRETGQVSIEMSYMTSID